MSQSGEPVVSKIPDGISNSFTPTTKRFYCQRDEVNTNLLAIVSMSSQFTPLGHRKGITLCDGRILDGELLDLRDDCNVYGGWATSFPAGEVNIGRSIVGVRD